MHRGDKQLAKHIATELIEQDFPISYAFTNSHHAEQHGPTELTHAFLNALLFLDWDRKGFDYPVVPNRGVIAHLDPKTKSEPFGDELGPPAPSAASCARLGGLLRDILEARSGKYVIMASSGWSHAFLVAKHHWLVAAHTHLVSPWSYSLSLWNIECHQAWDNGWATAASHPLPPWLRQSHQQYPC